ncbi:MAG: efflux RND transporter periplasmic adaptor subunit [Deltaproteobacteria bacterium]|nr:efflux RND transporter periplasmic adaptor subunit [Deltaproteobacteria bacterium]MBW2306498.1 efflux RND transporter periplasmic adaptor subunit [Deltaproteobacteria bacterium]
MSKWRKRLLHFAIAMAFIASGVLGLRALTASKPQLIKSKPTAPIPMVQAIQVKTGPQEVHVFGEGTVRPLREINLAPQVGGKVVYISPDLVNGGRFNKGDILLRIDPVDYQLAVILGKAKIKNAESRLKLAEAEADAAQEEWRLLHDGGPKETRKPPPLVAKEPQLAAAKAMLEADRAELSKALLNLERTQLKAPFDGRVGEESVDIGQYVVPGQALAALYSTEAAEIVVPLEQEDLYWFDVPGFTSNEGPGSAAVVRARIAGRERTWRGRVVRTEGKLDERTRMINVVVRVEKPNVKKPPLAVGLFVAVDIEGRTLPNATVIPRSALHQEDVVWVVDEDGQLHFRNVDIARIQGEEVIVTDGLKENEMVVINSLKAVTDGMTVHTKVLDESDKFENIWAGEQMYDRRKSTGTQVEGEKERPLVNPDAAPTEASKSKKLIIQVGAFRERKTAENLMRRLQEEGYDAYLEMRTLKNLGLIYRVRLRIYSSMNTAKSVKARLEKQGFQDPLILRAERN